MTYPIMTLDWLRSNQIGSEVRVDPKTGIKYTTDSLGNPIIIAPDQPTEGEELDQLPDQPGTGGFTYERAKAQMAPKTMEPFKDAAGNVVDLGPETDIRPYLFDPTLIQRESDLALLSGISREGAEPIGTEVKLGEDWEERRFGKGEPERERATFADPETGFVKLMPGAEPEPVEPSEEEKQRIAAASKRIDERAGIVPPGGPELPEQEGIDFEKPNALGDFKKFLNQRMGGDPNLINAHDEVMKMVPSSTVQRFYEDNWRPNMPIWGDLSESARSAYGTKVRSQVFDQFSRVLKEKVRIYNQYVADFVAQQEQELKRLKTIRKTMQDQIKQGRTLEKEEKTTEARKTRIEADLHKYKKLRREAWDEAEAADLDNIIKGLEDRLKKEEATGAEEPLKGKLKSTETAKAHPQWALDYAKGKKIDQANETKHGRFIRLEGEDKIWWFNPKTKKWEVKPEKSKPSEGAKSVGTSFIEE
jgi:hypothetical protein